MRLRIWLFYAKIYIYENNRKNSYSEDDLHLTCFTFDKVQVVSLENDSRDIVPMLFDQYSNTLVLSMMIGMSYLPGMGLGHRQQGPHEFAFTVDHDTP